MNFKGSLPTLILHSLSRGPSHGYLIAQQIKNRSQGVLDFKEGALYPALHNLEEKGLIESHTQMEKGRTRRYYQLTKTGKKQLETERKTLLEFAQALSGILGEA